MVQFVDKDTKAVIINLYHLFIRVKGTYSVEKWKIKKRYKLNF